MGIVLGLLVVLVIVGWLGLRVKPDEFPAYGEETPPLEWVPLPDGLPAPVVRYYQVITGRQDRVPRIESAVITGPARLRFKGITFNARFRFTHEAGQNYRHYIEATIFGQPLMKVNERYIDGHGVMELPFGTFEDEPEIDQGANLGLWGESMWLPSIWVTDERVRWEAIDDTHARLVVPFGVEEDSFTVTFDADSGLIATMEAMRYRDVGGDKIRWTLEPREWADFHGVLIPMVAAATWADEGTPWAVFTIRDIAYNVDVSAYLRARGL